MATRSVRCLAYHRRTLSSFSLHLGIPTRIIHTGHVHASRWTNWCAGRSSQVDRMLMVAHGDDVQGSLLLRVPGTVLPCAGGSGTHEKSTGGGGGYIAPRGSCCVSRPEGNVSNVAQTGDLVPCCRGWACRRAAEQCPRLLTRPVQQRTMRCRAPGSPVARQRRTHVRSHQRLGD